MPNYDYSCECGKKDEVFLTLLQLDRQQVICSCGRTMKRIISKGHGGTHGDEASWIRTTNEALSDEWSPKIENRTDLRKREKELGVSCLG